MPSRIKENAMVDDRAIARRALDVQVPARDYSMSQVPGYSEWSVRKLAEGESEAFIANLDARSMWLLPEELTAITESIFEEMLSDLKAEVAKVERSLIMRRHPHSD
jgi:hypothetical protein